MLPTDLSAGLRLPELPYGTVWLVGTGSGDPRHLLPLALHALATADVVLHDPAVPQQILDLVRPPRYREAASLERAIERSIKLARDGWRVTHLVKGYADEKADECGTRLSQHGIPLRVVSDVGESSGDKTPVVLVLTRLPVAVGSSEAGTAVMVISFMQSHPARTIQRERPADFSMAGLAS